MNNKINLYDYTQDNTIVGDLSSVYTQSTGRSGICLTGIQNKDIFIGYKTEGNTGITTLLAYENANTNSVPWIRNTASGTIFNGLSSGGITVQHGLITNWDMSGTWNGSYYVDVANTRYKITIKNGLMTNIEQV